MRRKSYIFVALFLTVTVLSSTVRCEECGSSNGPCNTTRAKEDGEKLPNAQEVFTHTPQPMDRPKSLNMISEDSEHVFRSMPLHSSTDTSVSNTNSNQTTAVGSEEPKGRALNFTVDQHGGNVLFNTSTHHNDFDLSDVSILDDDSDDSIYHSKILLPKSESRNNTFGICEKGGLTYENGEKLELGCDSICTCKNGSMDCKDRCSTPYFRTGKTIDDPLCFAKQTEDSCCSIMVCDSDTETEPLEICTYNNKTYNRGDTFNKECVEVCTCEIAGKMICKPRCAPTKKTSDRCVEVPDPNDFCCLKTLCDVTLDDNEPEKDEERSKLKILAANFVNSTTILLNFDTKFDNNDSLIVEVSNNKSTWQNYKVSAGGYVTVKSGAMYLKVENSNDIIDIHNIEKPLKVVSEGCEYKGKTFKLLDEYNDDCTSLCVCKEEGMKCLKMQCPTYFGVDVLDPNCVEWETVPPNFTPEAPNCCPESIHCKNNGSCEYEGYTFKNWEQLPINITGCEKRCYCEMGKVECQNACPPVTALPPPSLPCPPNHATISHIPDDDCCKYWICNSDHSTAANVHNDKESDTEHKPPTNTYMGPFAIKSPSKVHGPLAIYENHDDEEGSTHKPKLDPFENPYYSNNVETTLIEKSQLKNKTIHLGTPSSNKSEKSEYTSKNNSVFVTPTPISPIIEEYNNVSQNNIFSKDSKKSEPIIHDQQTPEEQLLQFIYQHPEISNYPSGSVLEIQNAPITKTGEPISHQGNGKPQIHLVPYLVPQNGAGEQASNDLPPGFTLDQILQEFHKNMQPQSNYQVPIYPNFGTRPQQSGSSISNRLNISYPDVGSPMFPPGSFPGFQQPTDDISVHTLEAIDAHTVRLAFMVPRVIVGLHGRVEVRYTHRDDDDIESWMLQVFAPPNDLIATPSLEFDLLDLKADTEYRIKITITLRDIHTTPTSRIYKIKTPKDTQVTTLPPLIPIEPDLAITDINATWVSVAWRKFTEYELQFIDGVQLRFKEIDGKIYAATPLIHRAVTSYTLENLKPNTKYEIGIDLIPFPSQLTELHAKNMLHFTTANEIDTYGFNVKLEVTQVKSQSVEITWNGVPYPEDKYVNIYRAIYQSDSGKEDHSTFKIAKRDSPTKTVILDLKPGTRYRIWLEVYLTNGKIKTSNVQDFITKPRLAPQLGSTQQDKLSRAQLLEQKGDYYGPLVIVAILAAIAILSTLVLLLILVRRHKQNKAAITPPTARISQSAYDNPSYKVEIQQETMGL